MDQPHAELRESRDFHCQKCGYTLAQSNAVRLQPTGSQVQVSCRGGGKLRLTCPECGQSQLWKANR